MTAMGAGKYSMEPVAVPRVETAHRRIVTPLPVPESLPVLEKLAQFEPRSMQGQPPAAPIEADMAPRVTSMLCCDQPTKFSTPPYLSTLGT